jgi:hypothetical protein
MHLIAVSLKLDLALVTFNAEAMPASCGLPLPATFNLTL